MKKLDELQEFRCELCAHELSLSSASNSASTFLAEEKDGQENQGETDEEVICPQWCGARARIQPSAKQIGPGIAGPFFVKESSATSQRPKGISNAL
jgi:hypothetical protein